MKQYRRITVYYCDECPYWDSFEVWCNKHDKNTPFNKDNSRYEIPEWCKLQKVTVVEPGEAAMSDKNGNVTQMKLKDGKSL